MAKRNLTVQLDEEDIDLARALADKRGTSISQLVAQQLKQAVDDDKRYEAAHRRALELMETAARHGGGRTWKREDLYDR